MQIAMYKTCTSCDNHVLLELIQFSLASSSILQRKKRKHARLGSMYSLLLYSKVRSYTANLTPQNAGWGGMHSEILDPEHQEVSVLPTDIL